MPNSRLWLQRSLADQGHELDARIGADFTDTQVSEPTDVIPGDISTPYSIAIGGQDTGVINTLGDRDWFSVTLTAGEVYIFTLSGSGGAPLSNPHLVLYNSAGAQVAFNDDADNPNDLNSVLAYTATSSGTYYLGAQASGDGATGDYTITAAISTPLDAINWGQTMSTTSIDVYFATAGQSFNGETALRSWTAAEINAAMLALGTFAQFTTLTFNRVFTPTGAEFVLTLADLDEGVLGYFEVGTPYGFFNPSGAGWNATGLQQGGYGFITLIHEFGHGLGLAHPHDNGGGSTIMPGVTEPFGDYGDHMLNQGVFTTMSYNDGFASLPYAPQGIDELGWQGTPMALDVALLQQFYGVNATTNAIDNVYQLQLIDSLYQCIWDTGGIDSITYAGGAATIIALDDATLVYGSGGGGYVSYVLGTSGGYTIAAGVVIENASGGSGFDRIYGNEIANVLDGNAGDDELYGSGGNDTLNGGAGADEFDGGAGDDIINGGAGDDLYHIYDTSDVVTELANEGVDEVESSLASYTLGANFERLVLVDGGLNGFGNDLDNVIFGNELANVIGAGGGNDIVLSGGGDDAVDVGAGDDIVRATRLALNPAENNTYTGGDGYDVLEYTSNQGLTINLATGSVTGGHGSDTFTGFELVIGGAGADTITGTDGADVICGGGGADYFDGGAGIDTYNDSLSLQSPSSMTVNLLTHTGVVQWAEITLFNIENVIGGSSGDTIIGDHGANLIEGRDGFDELRGNGGDDTLVGGNGNDILNGGAGADSMDGGAGRDTISYAGASGPVTIDLHLQTVSGADAAGDSIMSFEDAEGTAFDDVFVSSAAHNHFIGGLGNDTGSYANASQGIVKNPGSSHVTQGGFLDVLDSVESVIGSAFNDQIWVDLDAYGGGGDDILTGGFFNNWLDGGIGADQMSGQFGDDTYVVDNAGDVVTEGSGQGTDTVRSSVTRTLGANLEHLVLIGADAINGFGNGLNNAITGNSAANQLNGFDGSDTLDGAGGADSMFGGNGNDTYIVDNVGDLTTEVSALGGTDTVLSSVTRNLTANIENLTLTGAAAITGAGNVLNNTMIGNAGANTLYGFDGNDSLDGGAGADTLFGAHGDDTYYVDDVGDITVEGSTTGGIDSVISSISRNLNANFENLMLTGTAQFGYGNILGNVITGNASANGLYGLDGNDRLDGGAGADQMFGANGDDTYVVDNAADVTSEVSALGGVDTVESSVTRNLTANLENLVLTGADAINGAGNALGNVITGNSAANTLFGLDGADTLDGGLGADTLQGGLHADTYVFSTALGGGNVDTINGYNVADDTISLNNAIFTGLSAGALDANAFHIGAAAADADDRIIYDSASGALYFDADGDGAGAAVQFATLTAGLALTNADFIIFGS